MNRNTTVIRLLISLALSTALFAQTPLNLSTPEIESPLLPDDPETPPPTSYNPDYCSKRGRPLIGENHRRWTPPTPDPLFTSPDKLPFPATPADVHLDYFVGQKKDYKFRFRSQLIFYPKGSLENLFKISGFEDRYPEYANLNCTANITYPFHGVSISIQDGDSQSGKISIRGFSTINQNYSIPPYTEGISGVFGFSFTPDRDQVGKTYRLFVTVQTGVTPTERDYTFPGIYESDQVQYTVYLHVKASTAISQLEVSGNSGEIGFYATSDIIGNTSELMIPEKQWTVTEFYVDNQLAGYGTNFSQRPVDGNIYQHVKFIYDSTRLNDGWHTIKMKAKNGYNVWVESPVINFIVRNTPQIDGPIGPTPTASTSYNYDPRTREVSGVTVSVSGSPTLAIKDIYLFGSEGLILATQTISNYSSGRLSDANFGRFDARLWLGTYVYFKVRYIDGSVGVSAPILIPKI